LRPGARAAKPSGSYFWICAFNADAMSLVEWLVRSLVSVVTTLSATVLSEENALAAVGHQNQRVLWN